MTIATKQSKAVAEFAKLHESGCFIMPNSWDTGSSRILHHLGFRALATTSAGYGFRQGLPDSVTALSRDEVLAHFREIVEATELPVNADYQNGYSDDLDQLEKNVVLCVETGVAGLSIEDATGDDTKPLYDRETSIERIKIARKAIDKTKTGVVLTARCEAFLVGAPEPFETALDRLAAFAEAGADCLFAPDIRDEKQIEAIVKAVAPKPVNVIVSSPHPGLTLARLTELGVRRISVGSALSRVAMGAFLRAAKQIVETGNFESLGRAATFAELNTLFKSYSR